MFGAARPGPLVRGFAQLRVIKFLTLNHLSPMLSKHPGFDGPSIHVAPRLSASLQFWTVLGITQDSRVHAHRNRTKGALQDFIIPFPLVVLDLRNNIKVARICLFSYKHLPTWMLMLQSQFSDPPRRNLVVSNHQSALSKNIFQKRKKERTKERKKT